MLRLEERFRSTLLAWVDGADAAPRLDEEWQSAVDAAAGFMVTDATVYRLPSSPSGSVIVPAIGCHERAEQEVLRPLMARAPETIPALFAFYLEVYSRQISPQPPRRWLASRSRDRLFWLARQHKQLLPGSQDERRRRARMLLLSADAMQSAPFFTEILEARELLEEVVDLAPESVAARYMSATLAERTGDYDAAVARLARLARRQPEDPEVALRLAINRGRVGDGRAARKALTDLARGAGPEWIRILAYQEWVALAAGRGGGEAAVMAEALKAFPDDRQLSLQLAAAQIRAGEWSAAESVFDGMAAAETIADESTARALYDLPRRDELESEASRFVADLEVGVERLRRLLEAGDRAEPSDVE